MACWLAWIFLALPIDVSVATGDVKTVGVGGGSWEMPTVEDVALYAFNTGRSESAFAVPYHAGS